MRRGSVRHEGRQSNGSSVCETCSGAESSRCEASGRGHSTPPPRSTVTSSSRLQVRGIGEEHFDDNIVLELEARGHLGRCAQVETKLSKENSIWNLFVECITFSLSLSTNNACATYARHCHQTKHLRGSSVPFSKEIHSFLQFLKTCQRHNWPLISTRGFLENVGSSSHFLTA